MPLYPLPTNGAVDYPTRVGAMMNAFNQGVPRNLLINGAFDVAQHATSAALTTSFVYGSVDRWTFMQATSAQCTVSQAAPSPALPGFKNCLKILLTGASTGLIQGVQALETVDCVKYQGQNVVLSFSAVKGTTWNPASLGVQVYIGRGTDQSAASFASWTSVSKAVDTTASPGTAWARFEAAFAVPSDATQIAVVFYATPTGAAVDANSYLMLTGAKFEPGTVSTGWAPEIYTETLAKCQRYLPAFNATLNGILGSGYCFGAGSAQIFIPFKVSARVPALGATVSSGAHFSLMTSAGSPVAATGVAFVASTTEGLVVNVTGAAGLTAGNGTFAIFNNAAGQLLATGCEL